VLLLAAALPLFAYAAPSDDLKALLDQGKAADAYALGKKNPDQLGNPAFDFYFGIAAVDAGHAGEGVLALERYIANFPDNMQARLELARAYYVLGDNVRAREEFDLVQKSNPPAPVQANIERFRDAIRARESAYQTTAGFYAEIGAGYDSPVSGGVGSPNRCPYSGR
jgi:predicted Zn-dependent protease